MRNLMANKITENLNAAKDKLMQSISVDKPFTKMDMLSSISERLGVTRKKAEEFLQVMQDIMGAHIKKEIVFTWPGLFKLYVVKKAGTPERKGISPFTKQPIVFKAKPAYKTVRVKALKKLKNMADVENIGNGDID